MGARRFLFARVAAGAAGPGRGTLPPGEKPLPDEIKVIRYQAGDQTIE